MASDKKLDTPEFTEQELVVARRYIALRRQEFLLGVEYHGELSVTTTSSSRGDAGPDFPHGDGGTE